ncbi:MAG: sulfurtransferase TusA family protein [Acidiferrobacteraceae bacterium]|nr:sulfurtransferase TusA family protein [Acidiferrobacteraceae bacterium]MBT3640721.1 sulfurtransferase TusA family protein [Acidiferrobacteraceae bacterium]MBT3768279.1 sulfurtransferase TusA family protein [Acidiferrobacteraceae bacterium]MBT4393846.1 sulfurtransferase TusA family protein [Acidiferrobacteraceae bacterium]MBT4404973.1 sulfurtransferase TusA family protein [Acidiferrobacteraceae bacterium]
MSTYQLDATGLLCPLPVIRTQDRVATLRQGDVLSVHCTDPGALLDIPAWCRIHGHELLSTQENEEEVLICIRVRK